MDWEQWNEATVENDWQQHFQREIFEIALARCKPHFHPETWTLFEQTWLKNGTDDEVAHSENVRIEKIYVARSRVLKRLKAEVAILADDLN